MCAGGQVGRSRCLLITCTHAHTRTRGLVGMRQPVAAWRGYEAAKSCERLSVSAFVSLSSLSSNSSNLSDCILCAYASRHVRALNECIEARMHNDVKGAF